MKYKLVKNGTYSNVPNFTYMMDLIRMHHTTERDSNPKQTLVVSISFEEED